MKASELRMNNIIGWYEPNQELLPVKVNGIVGQMIYAKVNDSFQQCHENYQSWKPIPLTEAWLFKLGFYQNERGRWVQKGLDKFEPEYALFYSVYSESENLFDMWRIEHHDKECGQDEYRDCHQYLNRINYVHQLQNIWFALSGKELTPDETNETLKCEKCGNSEGVEESECPYQLEINEEHVTCHCCKDCSRECCESI